MRKISNKKIKLMIASPLLSLSLSSMKPLALVSLGCIYNMSWVDKGAVEEWIQSHALHTAESVVTQDGEYNFGKKKTFFIIVDDN